MQLIRKRKNPLEMGNGITNSVRSVRMFFTELQNNREFIRMCLFSTWIRFPIDCNIFGISIWDITKNNLEIK